MAYTTIDDPSAQFHIQLYSGDGNTNRDITNDANAGDFKPDWLWLKNRTDGSTQNMLFNSNVGMPNHLHADNNDAEQTATNKATVFNTDGFRIQDHSQVNGSGKNYVAWQWKANGGTTSSNGNGSVTSTVQANTTAGFSIVTYTGTGSGNTIGHGLGATPDWIIVKVRSTTNNWGVWHKDLGGANKYLKLNTNDSNITATDVWNNTLPTSTVFSTGAAGTTNDSGETYVAFCFTSIKGYSKFGSYVGDGSSDGTFTYTGFKPAYVMIKSFSNSGDYWFICDNKRDIDNPVTAGIRADTDNNENTGLFAVDFLSNGFKAVDSGGQNVSGRDYIYMAFAEHPFVSSEGVPVTAR